MGGDDGAPRGVGVHEVPTERYRGLSTPRLWFGVIAFGSGIALFHQLPFLLPPGLLALGAVAGCVAAYRWPSLWTGLLAVLMAGVFWQGWHAIAQLAPPFPAVLEKRTVRVEGWIAGAVESKSRRERFRFRVERLRTPSGEGRPFSGDLHLSWYRPGVPKLAYGQRWTLSVRVRKPRAFRNPGSFDYAHYLVSRHLSGTGYVRSEPVPQRLAGMEGNLLRRLLEGSRRTIEEAVAHGAGDQGALVRALAVGKRDQLGSETWEVLRATGTAHLVAISGLHVGWVALLVFTLARALWSRLHLAPVYLPAPQFAAGVALLATCLYAALAGFSLPTQRALIMAAVALGAWLWARPFRFQRSLAVAVWAILLWAPDSLFEAGFWLSFTAVAGIGLLLAGPLRESGWLVRSLGLQLGVVLVVSPWLAHWFGQASLVAPVANAGAIPYFSFLVVPLILVGDLFALLGGEMLAARCMEGADWLLGGALEALGWLADWPLADWTGPRPSWIAVALMLSGLAWLFLGRGSWRWAGVVLLVVPWFWLGPPELPLGHARIWILEVGQGSATVVETARHVAVVDCGPRFSPSFNAGEAIVAPFLQSRGWWEVDRLLISHSDTDHSGGCPGLRNRIPVQEVVDGPATAAPGGRTVWAGEQWQWDQVHFEVVSPSNGSPWTGNNASRVIRVEAETGAVLLPGDIQAPVEQHLVDSGAPIEADVLVAPHHGSDTSSSTPFITAVDPEWVVFSTGYLNQWGFPRPEVIARYRDQGVTPVTTAHAGAVEVLLGQGVEVEGYRERIDRYWHADAPAPPRSIAALLTSIL